MKACMSCCKNIPDISGSGHLGRLPGLSNRSYTSHSGVRWRLRTKPSRRRIQINQHVEDGSLVEQTNADSFEANESLVLRSPSVPPGGATA